LLCDQFRKDAGIMGFSKTFQTLLGNPKRRFPISLLPRGGRESQESLEDKVKDLAQDPTAWAGTMLLFGGLLWKALSLWSSINFLSVQSARFGLMFNSFEEEGWIFLELLGLWAVLSVWTARTTKREGSSSWLFLAGSTVLGVLSGALIFAQG
jgi:hypothetical protein